ncbi:hypothetical protein GCM10027280_10170 [Micromonospora polyrhachis]|uniref:Uncharacterized protein n=1 Tax=Micromonospora polyrhachis TaxID=1282883 RepID=A0A7W7SR01_9ACTN|nr:hypothetical protein [Micromonospora polyrhachis]MBB4958125.1 hypothetical protein [Micromonospora polyrhachis]
MLRILTPRRWATSATGRLRVLGARPDRQPARPSASPTATRTRTRTRTDLTWLAPQDPTSAPDKEYDDPLPVTDGTLLTKVSAKRYDLGYSIADSRTPYQ